MARGDKGKRFKPGESGNPNGRPPTSPEVKALRKLTSEYIEEIGDLILMQDWAKLQEIANSQDVPPIQRIYAKALVMAERKGDTAALEQFLNRVVGKVREKLDMSAGGDIRVHIYDYKENEK